MFDKFGEFGSSEELNKAADGMLSEGDFDGVKALAKENGIDDADVDDYIKGDMKELSTPITAALGRIDVQEKESKLPGNVKKVIYTIAKSMASSKPEIVMTNGKRLDEIYGVLRGMAENSKCGRVGVACGTDLDLMNIITNYLRS